MHRILSLMIAAVVLAGCTKDDPVVPSVTLPAAVRGVYVVNEGGFGKSTATLSFYVPDSGKVYADVFFAANKRSLGDVGNDIALYDGKAFIVVNNSHKIEIISTETHLSLGTIDLAGNSPNKITIASSSKAYVSNLYKGSVTSFDPATYAVKKATIPVGQSPQGLAVASGKVFVCNSGYGYDSTISVIDVTKDSVVKTIPVLRSPTDIGVTAEGTIVVICNGLTDYTNSANDTPGGIVFIDPATLTVMKTVTLPLASYGHPGELAVSTSGYGLTVVKNGVLKFDTKSGAIFSDAFLHRTPYSLAVDDLSGRIYTGDAKDYDSNGSVVVFSAAGAPVDSFTVGIIPGSFGFKK